MEIKLPQLIKYICLEFDSAAEYKIFFQILNTYLEDPVQEPLISYTDFQTTCNITNRNVVKRGIDKLIEKDYISRKEEGNKFRYKLTQKVIDMIKK